MQVNIVILTRKVLKIDFDFIIQNLSSSIFFSFNVVFLFENPASIEFEKALYKINRENNQNLFSTIDSHKRILNYSLLIMKRKMLENAIFITDKSLPSNFFSIYDNQKTAIISINKWNEFSPPPLEIFITKEILSYILLFKRKTKSKVFRHKETNGCFYDFTLNKVEIRTSLWGDICKNCKMRLKSLGVDEEIQKDVISIQNNCWSYNFKLKNEIMNIKPNPFLLDSKYYPIIKNQIFVALSWELVDSVYIDLKESLEKNGYIIKNAEDKMGQMVFRNIWELMNESEIFIVDFTGKRPNVYLEFGMALVLGKPIIVIVQDPNDLPSDINGIRWLKYKNQKGDSTFTEILPKMIKDTLNEYK